MAPAPAPVPADASLRGVRESLLTLCTSLPASLHGSLSGAEWGSVADGVDVYVDCCQKLCKLMVSLEARGGGGRSDDAAPMLAESSGKAADPGAWAPFVFHDSATGAPGQRIRSPTTTQKNQQPAEPAVASACTLPSMCQALVIFFRVRAARASNYIVFLCPATCLHPA
eukprot:SAG31_NODE_2003_length_6688_cov_2.812415_2_plen_169_part_00